MLNDIIISFNNIIMKRFLFTLSLIIGLSIVFGMTGVKEEGNQRPVVLSTVGMLDDIVSNLAGDFVSNELLMPSGTDPHVYIPTLKDVSQLNAADVIFAIGLDLEAQMESALDSLALEKTVLRLGEELSKDQLLYKQENVYDPHVWFDLDLFAEITKTVAATLISEFPEQSDLITLRLDKYLLMLEELDVYASDKLSQVAESARWLITTHDAFSYFARKYDFEIFTLQGVSTESDYSLKDKSDMVNLIIKHKIPAVFVEDSVSNKDLLSVIENAAAKSHPVSIGGYLFADSLGAIDSPYATFADTFKANVDTIFNALN